MSAMLQIIYDSRVSKWPVARPPRPVPPRPVRKQRASATPMPTALPVFQQWGTRWVRVEDVGTS